MKIGIDARFLTHPQHGGFKTYTENLVMALSQVDQKNEYILYVDRPPTATDAIPAASNFRTCVVTGSMPMIGLPWREQVGLARQAARDRIDLFHAPCLTAPLFLNTPLVITVHDMIWAFPERFSQKAAWSFKRKVMEWYNYFIPLLAIKRAASIITVSHAARESILEHMNLPAEKVDVTWEGARSSFRQVTEKQLLYEIREKYSLRTKFILAIGSADPRKNINTLVQAYSSLSRDLQNEYHLAIVWTHTHLADGLSRDIRTLGLEANVHFLQSVSNEDLVHLYNAASLFVFPSLYEGFGLPILEAMACGTPVIAANNSSIPEITGEAAFLFDAQDRQGLTKTIERVLMNEETRSGLIQKGLQRSATFSWEKCARETLAVYQKALSW